MMYKADRVYNADSQLPPHTSSHMDTRLDGRTKDGIHVGDATRSGQVMYTGHVDHCNFFLKDWSLPCMQTWVVYPCS